MHALNPGDYNIRADFSACDGVRPLKSSGSGGAVASASASAIAGKVTGALLSADGDGEVGLVQLAIHEDPPKHTEGDSRVRMVVRTASGANFSVSLSDDGGEDTELTSSAAFGVDTGLQESNYSRIPPGVYGVE